MGFGDELKGDFMQMLATLGILLGGILAFTIYSVSMWLLLLVVIIGAALFWFFKQLRR